MKSLYLLIAGLVVIGGLAFSFANSVSDQKVAKSNCGCPECCLQSGCCSQDSCCCDTGVCPCGDCDCSSCMPTKIESSKPKSCDGACDEANGCCDKGETPKTASCCSQGS